MNYIYKISVEEADWDEFFSFVVVAKNKKGIYDEIRNYCRYYRDLPFLKKEHIIKRIGITTLRPQIIDESFNAG